MSRLSRIILSVTPLLVLMTSGDRAAESQPMVVLRTAFPVQKEKTEIHVLDASGNPVGGATIEATYRPGSRVSVVSPVGITDSSGGADWIPQHAGVVRIDARWRDDDGSEILATMNASVRFASTPIGGIIIMIFAGVLLIGGSIVHFARLIWGKDF